MSPDALSTKPVFFERVAVARHRAAMLLDQHLRQRDDVARLCAKEADRADHLGEPTIAVDTHIFRVANRTGIAPGTTPLDVEAGLERITPAEYKLGAHHWLILHGRYVCKARKPDCPVCVVADLCRYGAKTAPSELIAARAEAITPAPLAEPAVRKPGLSLPRARRARPA